jgi:hypothetical protein
MKLLIKSTEGRGYVAPSGSHKSYTKDIKAARKFNSREEAERELCVESERIVDAYEEAGL